MNCEHFVVGVQIWNFDAQLLKTTNNNNNNNHHTHHRGRSNSSNNNLHNANASKSPGERLQCETAATNSMLIVSAVQQALNDLGNWNCVECGSAASPWLCLACGLIHCGRYVNQHAMRHFESQKDHSVCMDCYNYSIFCYKCEDFVSNDVFDSKISRVRTSLQYFNALRVSDHSYFAPVSDNSVVVQQNRKLGRRTRSMSSRRSVVVNCKSVKSETCHKQTKKARLDIEDSKEVAKKRGLRNLGNTCFMNAVLQSLNNIDEFCQYFVKLPQINVKKGGKTAHYVTRNSGTVMEDDVFLTEELRKMLIALSQSGNSAISPDSLFSVVWKLVPRFRGYQQQDAHEFLRCILDRLHCELQRLAQQPSLGNENSDTGHHNGLSIDCRSHNHHHNNHLIASAPTTAAPSSAKQQTSHSVITAIFEGTLESEVKCLLCQNLSKKYDPFLDLSLDIPAQAQSKKEAKQVSLEDCLASFFAEEHLLDTELYRCVNCRRKQPSSKQFYIRRLPNVLCLHLKRFRWSAYYRQKIDCFVEFPVRNLDMESYLFKNGVSTRGLSNNCPVYDLAAIVVHHGSGTGSGHYTTYVQRESSWHHFNDSAVRCCTEEAVLKQKAYILFYVRRNVVHGDSVNAN